MPEIRIRRRLQTFRWPKFLFFPSENDWRKKGHLQPSDYPIYADKNSVPTGVWENPNLVVEKFLPEKKGDLYYVRYWMFLGERGWAARFGSKNPIVKFSNRSTADERVPVPDELVDLRKRLGFDYGRFDYVVRDGRPIVFDINKTVAGYKNCAEYAAELDMLAEGIRSFGQ